MELKRPQAALWRYGVMENIVAHRIPQDTDICAQKTLAVKIEKF
jgi:hypothetical protein